MSNKTDEKPSYDPSKPRKYTQEELEAARWKYIRRIRYERVSC